MLDSVKESSRLNLKTARGMIDGILKMIDGDRYCIDISKQVLSSIALLRKANLEILRGHIKTCVAEAIKEGESEEKMQELFEIIEKYARA